MRKLIVATLLAVTGLSSASVAQNPPPRYYGCVAYNISKNAVWFTRVFASSERVTPRIQSAWQQWAYATLGADPTSPYCGGGLDRGQVMDQHMTLVNSESRSVKANATQVEWTYGE